jgi:3(or 17)beta-hydroxysteroid dehydrogenase
MEGAVARLDGRVALISGGASGIGLATAHRLGQEGAAVMLGDLQDEAGAAAVAALTADGARASYRHHDVTDEAAWESIVADTVALYGRLDVVVNNAGIGGTGVTTADTSLEEWNRVLSVNLTGVFLGTREAIRTMRELGNGGSIVNVSSILGLVGGPNSAAYSATKGGVRLFTKAAALECAYAGDAIRVNSVHPGYIDTPLVRARLDSNEHAERMQKVIRHMQPGGAMGSPEDIAAGIAYLASDDARFVNGSELVIDGAATAR